MSQNKSHIIVSVLLFLLISISYIIMALKFPVMYIIGTYEDFFGEWMQFYLFVAVFIISFRLSLLNSRLRPFFIILSIASFYTFMEEISWGQRLFHITPPDFFMKHNLQRETNLHNFFIGPYRTSLKIIMEYLIASCLVLYGLIYPAGLQRGVSFAKWIESKGVPSPPRCIWPYFTIGAILVLELFRFNEAEVAEILIPLGLLIFMVHLLCCISERTLPLTSSRMPLSRPDSAKLAVGIVLTFFIISGVAAGTTYALYSSQGHKDRMERKLFNGIEKFAGRYKRIAIWDNAIRLYNIIDEQEPDRPSIQRSLAYCFQKKGDYMEADDYIENAVDIDISRLKEVPYSISSNLSLAETYGLIGDSSMKARHLARALYIARERINSKPKSANTASWLGMAYEKSSNMQMDSK